MQDCRHILQPTTPEDGHPLSLQPKNQDGLQSVQGRSQDGPQSLLTDNNVNDLVSQPVLDGTVDMKGRQTTTVVPRSLHPNHKDTTANKDSKLSYRWMKINM